MKNPGLLPLFILCALSLSARETVSLNREWRFHIGSPAGSDNAVTVNLPHTWNGDALGGVRDYFRGTGNYVKSISVPREWSGRRVYIRFGGANISSTLFVNGRYAGEHHGGYSAFAMDITGLLNFGLQNTIWVAVSNSPGFTVLPVAGDANAYGGLIRDVELIVTNSVAISLLPYGGDGVSVIQKSISAERAEGTVEMRLRAGNDHTVQAQMTVFTQDMDTVANTLTRLRATREGHPASIPYEIDTPVLWNGTENPHLYNVGVKIIDDGLVTDSVVVATGFRKISVDASGRILLNDAPCPIRGVVVHQDRATVGSALTPAQVAEDVELIRQIGANAVRVSTFRHHDLFYDLCDRLGILVWNDMPMVGQAYVTDRAYIPSASFRQNGRDQFTEIIGQLMNHPSVFAWGIFSNVAVREDDPLPYLRELDSLARRLDPSRLTAAASNQDGEVNLITDIMLWNHHFGWEAGQPSDISLWLDQFERAWNHLPSGISFHAGASIYHQEDSLYRPAARSNWHPERWQTHLHGEYLRLLADRESLWGVFVGNMFDYGAAGYPWGEGNGVNDSGLVTFDRKYLKEAYFLYRAAWNGLSPFIHISGRRQESRRDHVQTITAFTNLPGAELVVNGAPAGSAVARNGAVSWEGVELRPGENGIVVRSGALSDSITVTVRPR